ncbi:MAG: hypothetical protein Q9M45_04660 [Robiginitomaculum sp.]|nr:hypothetical protein [Robiginitomaculum sp.]
MVVGASWNGARPLRRLSGPGISLMSEFIGFAYYAEIPLVLLMFSAWDLPPACRRVPNRPTYKCVAYASHGDTRHIPPVSGPSGNAFYHGGGCL